MPWFVSQREFVRLQRELNNAVKRAEFAEQQLAAERQSKDWLVLQLTSRVVTKHGGYGLDHERPEPAPSDPRKFTQPLSVEDKAKREYYIRCFTEAGRSEEE